jgi:hypothetical protein
VKVGFSTKNGTMVNVQNMCQFNDTPSSQHFRQTCNGTDPETSIKSYTHVS